MYERNASHIESLVRDQNDWRGACINLIASENVTSRRVRGLMGSDFAHRYAEGHPGERYYQGTEIIDEIESLLKQHMKSLFRCKHADVRPISGTIANDAVFSRYIRWGDIVMVNSTPAGGHISHHKAGSVGKYTKNIVNFPLTPDGWHIDVDHTLDILKSFDPKVLIMGKSLFLFPEPVKELAPYCRKKGIHLIYDAAHVLGLVAGGQFQDPLAEGASIVTGSTHKTFYGSQRGVILSNLDDEEWRKIDKGAFPGSSSNHHLETLVALTFATYEMLEFGADYARQVVANAKHFARKLFDLGFKVQARAVRIHRDAPGRHRHDRSGRRGIGRAQPQGQPHHREHEPPPLRAPGPCHEPLGDPPGRAGNDPGGNARTGDGADRGAVQALPDGQEVRRRRGEGAPFEVPGGRLLLRPTEVNRDRPAARRPYLLPAPMLSSGT